MQGDTHRLGGDIIVGIDHQTVAGFEQLRDAIAKHKPGDEVTLEIYRHGQKKSVTVKLGDASQAATP